MEANQDTAQKAAAPGSAADTTNTASPPTGTMIGAGTNERIVNNVMRHQYRVLTDDEKAQMQSIKDQGLEFFEFLTSVGESRELSLAKVKIEEAVMWSVKHITK